MALIMPRHIRYGLTAMLLATLAACGGAPENSAANASGPANAANFNQPEAVMPTIVPNAEALPSTHPNSIQPETTLNISATGEVTRDPDIAFISAGVQSEAKTAAEAMKANSTAMNGVFDALKNAGVAERDMQTSNFSLQPRYDYSSRVSGGSSQKLTGYIASNQLSVRVRKLDELGGTLDALVAAGGNTFSGLRFALEDDRAAKDEARGIAMRSAIARAELYAEASGYKVARIVTISESGGHRPQPMQMARAMSDESTPIASGEVGYSITVNVQFELRR